MSGSANTLDHLIRQLSRLPGIGTKSATRIAYYLLQSDAAYSESLAEDIRQLRIRVRRCGQCARELGEVFDPSRAFRAALGLEHGVVAGLLEHGTEQFGRGDLRGHFAPAVS